MSSAPVAATGETNLRELLRTMAPVLRGGEFVFANVSPQVFASLELASVECFFRESASDITVILSKDAAQQAGLPASPLFAWITLTVYSSLEAVGLTAAFARALGDAGISCNVVAAFFHDHIFVPEKDAARAMLTLREVAIANGASSSDA
jgi:uncharacterized protein